jgi:signal transduction histidine kinase
MRPEFAAGESRPDEPRSGCSDCENETEGFILPDADSPDRASWDQLHSRYHVVRRELDRVRGELGNAKAGLASYEGLFRISPFPIMEQDYTQVATWMEKLRAQGVTDIREQLPDVEAIRSVVPLIWIAAANPAAERAVGLPMEEMIGPIDPRIVNDESYPSWISQFEAVWNREPEAHASFLAGTPDGTTYDAESTLAAPILEGQPDFSRAMFTIVDVSAHRSEERRMEELISAKNEFVAAVSHEIRTPLTAIVGFSQVLEGDEDMADEDRMLMVTSIVEQAREMSDLVNDLLLAARAETGHVSVDAEEIDVVAQVRKTLEAGGSFTTNVQIEHPDHPATAIADPTRVRQILRNLLTNAERYGGPTVTVSIRIVRDTVAIDVVDDGPGLPEDQWESIFELYHRAHQEDSSHDSIGIGLAVSRQLAELMDGSLHYSREGGRSVFRLRLPRRPEG